MKRIVGVLWIVVPLILLIGIAILVTIWLAVPRVVEISPLEGAVDVPAGAPLVVRFSRPMRAAEVQARLAIEPQVAGALSWQGADTLVFAPYRPWPAGVKVQVRLQPGARPQRFPPLSMQPGRDWFFTIRQPRLAFLYPAAGPANIYLRDPVSGENRPLTNIAAGIEDYTISAGGNVIFYTAEDVQGGSDIYRLEIGGGPGAGAPARQSLSLNAPLPGQAELLVHCTPASCHLPAVSPDEHFLAYERIEPAQSANQTKPQIWLLSLDPGGEVASPPEPVPVSDPTHAALLPTWSPDNLLTYYDRDAQAFVLFTPEDGERRTLSNATGQPGDWQPDGRGFIAPEIIFLDANVSAALQQQLDPLADSHLLLYPQPEGAALDLTREEGTEDTGPAFSPDGVWLAFARKYVDPARWSPGRQIWLMEIAGLKGHQITDEPEYNHFDFAWSPDSRQLAYVRFNQSLLTEPPEVWVLDVESGETTQMAVGGYLPQWIP